MMDVSADISAGTLALHLSILVPQAAFSEAEALRRQEALIREEEESEAASCARTAIRAAADRDRKAGRRQRRKVPTPLCKQPSRLLLPASLDGCLHLHDCHPDDAA